MKLIIDIDKNVYRDLKEYFSKEYSDAVGNCGLGIELAIANGTPLEEELEKIVEYAQEASILRDNLYDNVTEYSVSIRDVRNIIDKIKSELKGK